MSARKVLFVALGLGCVVSTPAPARAERGAVTIDLRGGGYIRSDKNFVDHARTFGYDFRGSGGGGVEAGYEIVPRLSLFASWTAFTMSATRRLSDLHVSSQSVALHARYAVWRNKWPMKTGDVMAQVEGSFGSGLYYLRQTYEDPSLYPAPFVHSRYAPGVRFGVDASVYWRTFGVVLGYAFNWSPAHIDDQIGGRIYAGGHEVTAGFAVRF